MLLFFLSYAYSTIDKFNLIASVYKIPHFQHASGGFFDAVRQPNALDSMRGIYVTSIFGRFNTINAQSFLKYISSLRNRDGGCGLNSGQMSCISATYYYYVALSLVGPGMLDPVSTIEFLKRLYDHKSGLFRETQNSAPSLEATYYAYMIIRSFNNADLSWINNSAMEVILTDHFIKDHFEFDNINFIDAQAWANGIANAISFRLPNDLITGHTIQTIENGIKGNWTLKEVAKLALTIDAERLPHSVLEWIQLGDSLEDIYYATLLLAATKEINRFIDIKIFAFDQENNLINLEKDSVFIGQSLKPCVVVSMLNQVNPWAGVNITIEKSDGLHVSEFLEYQKDIRAFAMNQNIDIKELGIISIKTKVWANMITSTTVTATRILEVPISIPLQTEVRAFNYDNSLISLNSEVYDETRFIGTINSAVSEDFKIDPLTKASMTIFDSSGEILYHNIQSIRNEIEFKYKLESNIAIPKGKILVTVKIGDQTNGIYYSKDFIYYYSSTMVVSNITHKNGLFPKIGERFKVCIQTGVKKDNRFIPFSFINNKSDSISFHKYQMVMKSGNIVIKNVNGIIQNSFVVFETEVENCIDFVYGFAIDFIYIAKDGTKIPLSSYDKFINVSSDVNTEIIEDLPSGKVEIGSAFNISFKIKESITNRTLNPNNFYPVLIVKSKEVVLSNIKLEFNNDIFKTQFKIDALYSEGKYELEIGIQQGRRFVLLDKNPLQKFTSTIRIIGNVTFSANVLQRSDVIIIDYLCIYKSHNLSGGSFEVNIMTEKGEIVSVSPLASMNDGNRLSWMPKKTGNYILNLHRKGDMMNTLITTRVTISYLGVVTSKEFLIEGTALVMTFFLFVWAIRLRREFRIIEI